MNGKGDFVLSSRAEFVERCDALAVVKTPLQLLNASEARHHFEFRRPVLYLLTSRTYPPARLRQLVDEREWAAIHNFPIDIERRQVRIPLAGTRTNERATEVRWVLAHWDLRRRFDGEFGRWRGVPNIVIGNYYQSHFKHLARLCRDSRSIVVDDGTDTLRIAQLRNRRSLTPESHNGAPSLWREPKRWWTYRYVDWDARERDELTFFTSYELNLRGHDHVIRNSYRMARSRVHITGRDSRCLFLGQPLVEDGYVSADCYVELLTGVKRALQDREVFYVPHPREDRERMLATVAATEIPRFEIDKPIEFYLLNSAPLPATIASFFCSALDNCRLIWGDAIRLISFAISQDRLLDCHGFVADIYDYFATRTQNTIEVLKIDEEAG